MDDGGNICEKEDVGDAGGMDTLLSGPGVSIGVRKRPRELKSQWFPRTSEVAEEGRDELSPGLLLDRAGADESDVLRPTEDAVLTPGRDADCDSCMPPAEGGTVCKIRPRVIGIGPRRPEGIDCLS